MVVSLALCVVVGLDNEDTAAPGPPIRGVDVHYSLLAFPGEIEVVAAPEGRGVTQGKLKPRGSGTGLAGSLPAVIAAPPSVVRYHIEAPPLGAVFRYALAVGGNGYMGEGEVSIDARIGGDPLFEHRLDCSKAVPRKERSWHEFEVDLPAGGLLEISLAYAGDARPPDVGLGLLEVGVPFEVDRHRSSRQEPNIVLVVIDTLRADRLHCYGNGREVSPVMDSIASRGTRFERAYSSTAWTVPSTASIMTGRSPHQMGIASGHSYSLSPSVDTLGETLQRAGFTTAAFVCNPLIDRTRGFHQGFEFFHTYRWNTGAHIGHDVAQWIEENRDRRFFLYLHYTEPHGPYVPSERATARFVSSEAPAGFTPKPSDVRDLLVDFYGGGDHDPRRIEAIVQHHSTRYDAEIFDVDEALGGVLTRLQAHDLADATVVCVTSDHGEEFLEHGWFGHHEQLFEESIRVPLILAGPKVPSGRVIANPVENRNVAATLLRLAGAPTGDMGGSSLLDSVESAGVYTTLGQGTWADFDGRAWAELGPVHSLIEGSWQLVYSPGADLDTPALVALYDRRLDPEAHVDVAAEHRDVVATMRERIHTWLREGAEDRPRQIPPSDETRELLRSLGYVDGDG
jgi:arylsulfatase A-like enzyme